MAPQQRNFVCAAVLVGILLLIFYSANNWGSTSHTYYPTSTSRTDNTTSRINCKLLFAGDKDQGEHAIQANRTDNTTSRINCKLLFAGDKDQGEHAIQANKQWPLTISPDALLFNKTSDCTWIEDELIIRDSFYISSEEKAYPLAFAMNIHDSAQQVIRLLKTIYRPHNTYCIHYDEKSSPHFKGVFDNIAKCLPNVVIPREIVSVNRGWHTVVDAQMNCFKQLLSIHKQYPWQYVITLCGKELPLRTNREMVRILKKLNSTSAVQANKLSQGEKDHVVYKWKLMNNQTNGKEEIVKMSEKNGPVPFNLTIYKFVAYFGLSVKFVHFLVTDDKVATVRSYMDHTVIPEELFIATVFKMPGAPGGYNEQSSKYIPIISGVIWLSGMNGTTTPEFCNGWNVHSICVCSSADLHRLDYQPHWLAPGKGEHETLFHNKYFLELDHIAMECMEEELVRRNKEEYRGDLHISWKT